MALITFDDSVDIYGDCSQVKKCIPLKNLDDYDFILNKGIEGAN